MGDLDWYKIQKKSELKDKIHYFHDHVSEEKITRLQKRVDTTVEENAQITEKLESLNRKYNRLKKILKIREAEIAVMKDCDVINSDKATKSDSNSSKSDSE